MGKIKDYTVSSLNANDKITLSDGNTGATKNVLASSFAAIVGGAGTSLMYKAFLTQTGTDAPVATELVNTLGITVDWTYVGVGWYEADISSIADDTNSIINGKAPWTGTKTTQEFISNGATSEYVLFSYLQAGVATIRVIDTNSINTQLGTALGNGGKYLVTIEVYQ